MTSRQLYDNTVEEDAGKHEDKMGKDLNSNLRTCEIDRKYGGTQELPTIPSPLKSRLSSHLQFSFNQRSISA
jgi:hypothetical protein